MIEFEYWELLLCPLFFGMGWLAARTMSIVATSHWPGGPAPGR